MHNEGEDLSALSGRVAVVIGGTSGIGAATAKLFSTEGATVVIAGRRTERGEKLAAELGPGVRFARTDVTVEADVQRLIAATIKRVGKIDCLVNSAGDGGSPGGIASADLDRMRQTWRVHVEGVVAAMKHAAPVMAAQGSGSIVNVASIGGKIGGWTFHDYAAAKAAVIQLTRTVAVELADHGVRVNCVAPGPVLTGIFGKTVGIAPDDADLTGGVLEPVLNSRVRAWQPIGRAGVPSDVASALLWLASDASGFVTGQTIYVDGGITAGRPAAAAADDQAAIGEALRRGF